MNLILNLFQIGIGRLPSSHYLVLKSNGCRLSIVVSCLMAVVTALPGCGSDSDRRQLSNSDAASTAAFGDQKRSVTQSRAAKSHRPINHAKRFVGSEACRTCHAEVSAEYDSHPMAHSMFRTSAGDGLEDIRTSQFSTTPHLSYYAEDKDGQVFHHERRIDEEGNEVYDQAVPVDLTVGS